MDGGHAAKARLLDALRGRSDSERARLEGAAVGRAIGRWRGIPDPKTLTRLVGEAPRYLSVGHNGLDARCLGAVASVHGGRTAVVLHDTIPLDWPLTQKPGATERFRQKLGWVARATDLVIVPSEATARSVDTHLRALGYEGEIKALPFGVRQPRPGQLPDRLLEGRPFFLALGTIEPRKNHGLLLDLWDKGAPAGVSLVIAGRRGWRSEAIFRRLDQMRQSGRVIEINAADDGTVDALLSSASGLLFPSNAEGYGFPPLEAAALGTPVVSSPLPQVRERLGDWPVYADSGDLYQWQYAVRELAAGRPVGPPPALPTWPSHFNGVLSSLG